MYSLTQRQFSSSLFKHASLLTTVNYVNTVYSSMRSCSVCQSLIKLGLGAEQAFRPCDFFCHMEVFPSVRFPRSQASLLACPQYLFRFERQAAKLFILLLKYLLLLYKKFKLKFTDCVLYVLSTATQLLKKPYFEFRTHGRHEFRLLMTGSANRKHCVTARLPSAQKNAQIST